MTDAIQPETQGQNSVLLHRMIFRLHFYAGVIVAPFLLILSVTGAIYLFVTEIEDFAHPDWRFASEQGVHLSPEKMVDGALAAFPETTPTRIDLPTAPERTAVVFLTPNDGNPYRVYVDPISGEALGSFVYGRTLIGIADTMHGSLMMGERGDLIVELASCWAIILILSGLYLWWPRTSNKLWGVFIPRISKGRPLWRDLHAVTGMWASLLILFLIVTGLPWASNWGSYLQKAMTVAGLGYPETYRTHTNHGITAAEKPTVTLAETAPGIPWALEPAPAPHSSHTMRSPISVGDAAEIFSQQGLTTAYRLVYPADAHDVYTGYTYPDQPEGQRTIHIDQYTGEVINDVGFDDYGVGAKSVELGVAIHMGNYFGIPNQILMLFAAFGAAALSITGPIMWLKRRKTGLGAPKAMPSDNATRWIVVLFVIFGIMFPVLGITALVVFALERFVLCKIEPARQWLGLAS